MNLSGEQWKELVNRSNLGDQLREAGFSDDDVEYLLADAPGQLAWRDRQWNGRDPATAPTHYDQPIYLRFPNDLKRQMGVKGKPEPWIMQAIRDRLNRERRVA